MRKTTKKTKTKEPLPKCIECGVCCISPIDQDAFCDLEAEDVKRLGPCLARRYVQDTPLLTYLLGQSQRTPCPPQAITTVWRLQRSGPFKHYEFNTCVFLHGVVLRKVACRVYERRPNVCRKIMQPGDRACRKLRQCFLEEVASIDESRSKNCRRSGT